MYVDDGGGEDTLWTWKIAMQTENWGENVTEW